MKIIELQGYIKSSPSHLSYVLQSTVKTTAHAHTYKHEQYLFIPCCCREARILFNIRADMQIIFKSGRTKFSVFLQLPAAWQCQAEMHIPPIARGPLNAAGTSFLLHFLRVMRYRYFIVCTFGLQLRPPFFPWL